MGTKVESESRRKKNEQSQERDFGKFTPLKVKIFAGDVKKEFEKIAWPGKKHTAMSSVVVVVFVSLLSFYLFAVDAVIGTIVNYFLN